MSLSKRDRVRNGDEGVIAGVFSDVRLERTFFRSPPGNKDLQGSFVVQLDGLLMGITLRSLNDPGIRGGRFRTTLCELIINAETHQRSGRTGLRQRDSGGEPDGWQLDNGNGVRLRRCRV